ncbi:hypothetical protein WK68_09015 [Burkholderia ubonensis]|nr:hypothetical protein WK68_09015 [Burkholderia ubonensis]
MNIDLGSIAEIEPVSDLYMKSDDGKSVRIFTRGQRYRVEKWLHDLRVTDDTVLPNHVDGEYLVTNFRLHRVTAK